MRRHTENVKLMEERNGMGGKKKTGIGENVSPFENGALNLLTLNYNVTYNHHSTNRASTSTR